MSYVANPDDITAPTLSTLAGTAQDEFIQLKKKINNVFLASGYSADVSMQAITAGLIYIKDIPAGTSTSIAYGFAADVSRNDTTCPIPVVGGQFNGRLGSNVNGTGAVDLTIFGIATEAWTGDNNSQATLKGAENAIISQANNNIMQLRGLDVVFKNRSDNREMGGLGPVQGLGSNLYNANSAGITFSSNNRSVLYGEYCGWGTGMRFNADCLDIWWDKAPATGSPRYFPAIGIDFSRMLDPSSQNPWSAHRMTSALALKEYMSITWDGLKQLRSYCDSARTTTLPGAGGPTAGGTLWVIAQGGQPALNGDSLIAPTKSFGYDYVNNLIVMGGTVGGVPGAITASMKININNTYYYVGLTAA